MTVPLTSPARATYSATVPITPLSKAGKKRDRNGEDVDSSRSRQVLDAAAQTSAFRRLLLDSATAHTTRTPSTYGVLAAPPSTHNITNVDTIIKTAEKSLASSPYVSPDDVSGIIARLQALLDTD